MVSPPVEAIMSLIGKINGASDPEQVSGFRTALMVKKSKLEKNLAVEVAKRREALSALEAFKASFPQGSEFGKSFALSPANQCSI